jgi:alcohol dehydrogenase
LKDWKADNYVFGMGVLDQIGAIATGYGKKTLVVCNQTYMKPVFDRILKSLGAAGIKLAGGAVAPM